MHSALKSERRDPKPERTPKPEIRVWPRPTGCRFVRGALNSIFGLLSSEFGIELAPTVFRAVLSRLGNSLDNESLEA